MVLLTRYRGINNSVKEVARTDAIFWGFAEECPDFILGCKVRKFTDRLSLIILQEFWANSLEHKHTKKIQKHDLLKHPKSIP